MNSCVGVGESLLLPTQVFSSNSAGTVAYLVPGSSLSSWETLLDELHPVLAPAHHHQCCHQLQHKLGVLVGELSSECMMLH